MSVGSTSGASAIAATAGAVGIETAGAEGTAVMAGGALPEASETGALAVGAWATLAPANRVATMPPLDRGPLSSLALPSSAPNGLPGEAGTDGTESAPFSRAAKGLFAELASGISPPPNAANGLLGEEVIAWPLPDSGGTNELSAERPWFAGDGALATTTGALFLTVSTPAKALAAGLVAVGAIG